MGTIDLWVSRPIMLNEKSSSLYNVQFTCNFYKLITKPDGSLERILIIQTLVSNIEDPG